MNIPKTIFIPELNIDVCETPITVSQYRAFCKAKNRQMPEQPFPHDDDNPIVNVTFDNAIDYARWLSNETDREFRLPTEAEYSIYVGDHVEGNKDIAVYGQQSISKVKTKKPNKYGLYDVIGCVWQMLEEK